ncbi:hypothetical protein [Rhodococcus sp. CH91]|nr:hypothetical protein [Rhodococcus sp. CH91]
MLQLDATADEVVPLLRARGLYRHEHETSTLRDHFRTAEPIRDEALHAVS